MSGYAEHDKVLQFQKSPANYSRKQLEAKFDVCFPKGDSLYLMFLKGGEKTPTPKISALLRKRPVLLRTNFVLTKDRKRPYYGRFCGKIHREGSCSKAAGGP